MAGFSSTIRTNMMTQIINAADAGAGASLLRVYTATQPATGGSVGAATLLATLTMSDPCGTASGGVLTFSAITSDSSADATGTAAWARLVDSSGTFVADFTVSATGGGGDIQFNTVSFVTGATISITSFTITAGNA